MAKSALKRPGDDRGLTAAEANEIGRREGDRSQYPERTEKWDFMTAGQIDGMDGSNQVPEFPILSGEAAKKYIEDIPQSPLDDDSTAADLRCNCADRQVNNGEDEPRLPSIHENGICSACGVLR